MLCQQCKGFMKPVNAGLAHTCTNPDCSDRGKLIDNPHPPMDIFVPPHATKTDNPSYDSLVENREILDALMVEQILEEPVIHKFAPPMFPEERPTSFPIPLPVHSEDTPMNVGEKDSEVLASGGQRFETGAVRGTDKNNVQYHLISPFALERLGASYSNPIIPTDPKYLVNFAIGEIYMFLNLPNLNQAPERDLLAVATVCLFKRMQLQDAPPPITLPPANDLGLYTYIDPAGLRRLAETHAEGTAKYGYFNWERGMPIGDLLNHAIAHLFTVLSGVDSGEDDLAHAAWNLMAAMHMEELHMPINHQLRPNHPSQPLIDGQTKEQYDAEQKAIFDNPNEPGKKLQLGGVLDTETGEMREVKDGKFTGWIMYTGKECPVDLASKLTIRMKNSGGTTEHTLIPNEHPEMIWDNDKRGDLKITHYRKSL